MSTVLDRLGERLAVLRASKRYRQWRVRLGPAGRIFRFEGRDILAFASNDYLGLAADRRLIAAAAAAAERWGVGAGASHALGGHSALHAELETQLAAFVGAEDALLFSTGYMANIGLVTALAGRGETVFADRRNHASLIDAVRLAGATQRRYRDLQQLTALLAETPRTRGEKLIISDAVFSMDGDIAPLAPMHQLANEHDAWLLIDDAHGFGVLGPQGRGSLLAAGLRPAGRCLLMVTLGKAAGVAGAFVAGDRLVIAWLRQKARSAIYTTAQPPLLAATVLTALPLLAAADAERAHLAQLIERLRQRLVPIAAQIGWRLGDSPTPIQPLIVGGDEEVLALAEALLAAGIWVPAIRPPTVPEGSARLRISLSALHTAEDIDRLLAQLERLSGESQPHRDGVSIP